MRKDFSFDNITPGKLTNITDIKILLCYIMQDAKTPLSKESIIEILCGNDLADYFDVSVSIEELIENGCLKSDENSFITISPKGIRLAKTLETALPLSVREKATEQALKITARTRAEAQNEVTIEKENDNFFVTFKINDGTDEMLNLKLYVSDEIQAQRLKEQFLNAPTKLYSGIIDSLLS